MDTGLIARQLKALTTPVSPQAAIATGAQALLRAQAAPRRRAGRYGGTLGGAKGGSHGIAKGGGNWPARGHRSPWSQGDGFQLGAARQLLVDVVAQGRPAKVLARWSGGELQIHMPPDAPAASARVQAGPARTHVEAGTAYVVLDRQQTKVSWPVYDVDAVEEENSGGAVRAPINGKVAKLLVETGAKVAKGDRIAIVEAMKMEHVLVAPTSGVVSELTVCEGAQVRDGEVLARIT
jgi:biotin carboxyl carrier protein